MKPAGKNMSVLTLPSTLRETLHDNHLALVVVQCILQPVAQHDNERQALAQLVRTAGRPWRPPALQLVQHPMRGRKHTFHVFPGTACHCSVGPTASSNDAQMLARGSVALEWLGQQ